VGVPDDKAVAEVEDAIRSHVAANPRAADTLQGIHDWWLPRRLRHRVTFEQLQSAVDALADAGLLEAREGLDGETLFLARRDPR
jgi:hypothetical protein